MSPDGDLTRRVAKATAAALAVVALAAAIWQVRSILILLLLAITFAAAIRPGVEWLGRHRVPQSVAILLHLLVIWAQGGRGGRRDLLHGRGHLVLRLGARLDHQPAHHARAGIEARHGP
jgi:hypothetical protein